MGVLTASNESSELHAKHRSSSESDCYSSNEESRLIPDKKESASEKRPYPKSVIFIIGNEFCERFNYYGLRTILTIYLSQRLYYSEDSATFFYHLFTSLAYFSPVFGALLADSFLGKFNTILYVSILYAGGCIVLSGGSFPQDVYTMRVISLIGLFIISFGTGGIKPCVSAFGGDQFEPEQEKELQQFFSVFYLSINLGSVISTALTPVLREDVHCLGERTCYPLAFGVPSLLMVIAVLFFICGKPLYKIRPPEGNIMIRVTKCVCYAIGKKLKSSEKKKSHWLDYAEGKFEKELIRDIKILFHVFVLFIPLPFFWALFDQQGSRWILQATRMNGEVGGYHIKADQMQVVNPLLIIIFIPLFEYVVYPLLQKCNILTKPLQRITTGGSLAALSFIIAGLIQLKLEERFPVMPSPGYSQITVMNNFPCSVDIQGGDLGTIEAFKTRVTNVRLYEEFTWNFTSGNCSLSAKPYSLTFNASTPIESMMITLNDGNIVAMEGNDSKKKARDGEPQVRLFYNIDKLKNENITFLLQKEQGEKYYIDTEDTKVYGMSKYGKFPPGKYKIYAPYNNTAFMDKPVAEVVFRSGGLYIINIYNKGNTQSSSRYEMVEGNEMHILLQTPQYLIITAGEIMFSITGLEFSYSQAPYSMKSVIQAVWLLTVAFGNVIVLIIAKLQLFEKMSHELFLFATLMGVDMVIFAILAYFYKYIKIKTPSEEAAEKALAERAAAERAASASERSADKGTTNEAYVEETDFNT